MVTPDNPKNQNTFFMLNRLILKVTKFQLPPPKHLGTVVKNILGGHHAPPMSNMVKAYDSKHYKLTHCGVNPEKYSDRSFDVQTEQSEMQMKYKTSRLNLQGNETLASPNRENVAQVTTFLFHMAILCRYQFDRLPSPPRNPGALHQNVCPAPGFLHNRKCPAPDQ